MSTTIRIMTIDDKEEIINMMRVFYTSPAVLSDGTEEIYANDVDNCVGDCPFVEGYIFQDGESIQGYGMVAKSFSTEFGKPCIWIEDLYVKDKYRGLGIGSKFLKFVEEKYLDAILRLEVEEDYGNEEIVHNDSFFENISHLHILLFKYEMCYSITRLDETNCVNKSL